MIYKKIILSAVLQYIILRITMQTQTDVTGILVTVDTVVDTVVKQPKVKEPKQPKVKEPKVKEPKQPKQPKVKDPKQPNVSKKCKILVAHLDKLKFAADQKQEQKEQEEQKEQDEQEEQEEQEEEAKQENQEPKEQEKQETMPVVKKKRAPRAPRVPSAKKSAAIASAIIAETDVVHMVLDMRAAFAGATAVAVNLECESESTQITTSNEANAANEAERDVELCEDSYDIFDDFSDDFIISLRLTPNPAESESAPAEPEPAEPESADAESVDAEPESADAEPESEQKKPKCKSHRRVFRHEFCPAVFAKLKEFTSDNSHLDRKAHKLAWQQWVLANNEMITQETARLQGVGYAGDVTDKMFKACRYYVAKVAKRISGSSSPSAPAPAPAPAEEYDSDRTLTDSESEPSSDQSEPTTTTLLPLTTTSTSPFPSTSPPPSPPPSPPKTKRARTYIPIDKSVLQAMDEHIIIKVLDADSGNELKPSACYAEFCSNMSELIVAETARLMRVHADRPAASTTAEASSAEAIVSAVADKLKATYKNRMFLIKRAHD